MDENGKTFQILRRDIAKIRIFLQKQNYYFHKSIYMMSNFYVFNFDVFKWNLENGILITFVS